MAAYALPAAMLASTVLPYMLDGNKKPQTPSPESYGAPPQVYVPPPPPKSLTEQQQAPALTPGANVSPTLASPLPNVMESPASGMKAPVPGETDMFGKPLAKPATGGMGV